ncbi:hypothetical protein MJO28_004813 [Puccinia striiformis f. sp. tritici]|uniref:Uncharacterized protein n=2 Tax=Puccinia striiformis f. sp. tritici TaxID=168172 RepID=A0A0L0VMS5_9BASI|nr:hypothetical protein MJO28_004813 [Puccinia striiformis f. sp. tritici]KNF00556.1 hypothetical protein PSTG_06249 [Puccinia striiformis f. sp. tritici PST-78]
MASFADLPAELIHKIIVLTIYHGPACRDYYQTLHQNHHELDHNQIGAILQKPRPHLEFREYFASAPGFDEDDDNFESISTDLPQPHVSWPDGLPSNPLVVLSLVNRALRRCAQKILFENVCLKNQWQAHLFLQTLTEAYPEKEETRHTNGSIVHQDVHTIDPGDEMEIDQLSGHHDPTRLNKLARYVRSLHFEWSGPCSMGKGGARSICDIIRSCPLLEDIIIRPTFVNRCKEPILDALASRRSIKEIVIYDSFTVRPTVFRWRLDEVSTRLFSQWESLHTIEFVGLIGRSNDNSTTIPQSIVPPLLNRALRTIILTQANINEEDLSWMLKGSLESLRTLEIKEPGSGLTRLGLFKILTEYTSPDLEILKIEVHPAWHRIEMNIEGSDDPTKNLGLMDIIFKSTDSLKKLKTLYISGALVGTEFFQFLPQSIIKLAWDNCDLLEPAAFIEALSSFPKMDASIDGDTPALQWLPNLKCCSIQDHGSWRYEYREKLAKSLRLRGVCLHAACGSRHGSDFEEDSGGGSDFE